MAEPTHGIEHADEVTDTECVRSEKSPKRGKCMKREWRITTTIALSGLIISGVASGIVDRWAPWVWARDFRSVAESAYDESYRRLLEVQQQRRLVFRGVEPRAEAERQSFLAQEEQRLRNRLEQLKLTKERYR